MRHFETGATRDTAEGKPDYEGFLHPLVIEAYGRYMLKHQVQADGKLRDSDNWQKGIPKEAYIKSMFRHFVDLWKEHRGIASKDGIEEALCAIIFNASGYLYELKRPRVTHTMPPNALPDSYTLTIKNGNESRDILVNAK